MALWLVLSFLAEAMQMVRVVSPIQREEVDQR